ncbi:P-loop containing nucleoside triphosphate hydrolase protein [Pavlovales sp. CCMP2436]|nr:P-loop containing nucleoside triphosphate hydrolase protein [Pavlovales sp. CCMP2436]|mmetsp:Transcript_13379/g.34076  ORF Transcript_13379/g.34076 Transcript_13379/m.34076 type:complete len:608 (-) Transcript_13379:82-1905(-)
MEGLDLRLTAQREPPQISPTRAHRTLTSARVPVPLDEQSAVRAMDKVDKDKAKPKILNVNVGVLGHVDSGKTSLARALSTMSSTASFDRHPQSKERGMTLDLGFSAFMAELPEQLTANAAGYEQLQFTLVDCPGHASLIRTVIGGAQIIDMMLLVIDLTKGIQTQTAECLVVGELTADELIVVLNKQDLLPEATRTEKLDKMKKGVAKALSQTKFKDAPMISVAARPFVEGADDADLRNIATEAPVGIEVLIEAMRARVALPERSAEGALHFAIDHCFPIKGQGTVLTGTILSGSMAVNQTIEFPELKVERRVKSIQMFKKSVNSAGQGDRVGVCVTQLDADKLERGIACAPGSMKSWSAGIVAVRPIRYFKGTSSTYAKFHLTVGHSTVMAKATFFGLPRPAAAEGEPPGSAPAPAAPVTAMSGDLTAAFDFTREYAFLDALDAKAADVQWALIELEQPVTSTLGALLIASHLESDVNLNVCRLAFYGRLLEDVDAADAVSLGRLRVYKNKCKTGQVDRVQDERTIIGKNLFSTTTDVNGFANMRVHIGPLVGTIVGSFGKSKFKMDFPAHELDAKGVLEAIKGAQVELRYRRFIYDPTKKMVQTK